MKKAPFLRPVILVPAVVLLLAVVIGLTVWLPRPTAVFDGSRVCNSDRFYLEFTRMNKDDSHVMLLDPGDVLHVRTRVERGRVDVFVTNSDKVLYRGNSLSGETAFDLPFPDGGSCTILVNARGDAAGMLDFAVQ